MIRKIVFRLHLSVAAAVGLVVLMLAATGVILSLEGTVTGLAERRHFVAPAETAPLPPATLVRAAEAWGAARGTPLTATSLRYRPHPRAPVRVDAGRALHVYVDPFRADVLGHGPGAIEHFFTAVHDLHRWFAVPAGSVRHGRAVTGAVNVAFLFLLVTGPFLWLPSRFTKRALANVLLFQRGARGAWRDLNWHQVIGIWTVIPLAMIAVTGAVLSYPAVADRVYPVVGQVVSGGRWGGAGPGRARVGGGGGVGPSAEAAPADLEAALRVAGGWVGDWESLTLTLPRPSADEIRVEIRGGGTGQPQKTGTLTLDAATGTPLSWETFADETAGRRAQEFLRYAHTGEYWGVTGRMIAGLCSLGATFIVWTGLALAMRRLRRWLALRRARGS
ncbi:MAG: PepSY-associated TM helix domain-containing protein [Gemmatimonadota bacterium]|nr:PepSY-associated TM helix domain-containing protein [Gemmatimonadota bacterium]